MAPDYSPLIEEMSKDELKKALRHALSYSLALQQQRERAATVLDSMQGKWLEGTLLKTDWDHISTLVY